MNRRPLAAGHPLHRPRPSCPSERWKFAEHVRLWQELHGDTTCGRQRRAGLSAPRNLTWAALTFQNAEVHAWAQLLEDGGLAALRPRTFVESRRQGAARFHHAALLSARGRPRRRRAPAPGRVWNGGFHDEELALRRLEQRRVGGEGRTLRVSSDGQLLLRTVARRSTPTFAQQRLYAVTHPPFDGPPAHGELLCRAFGGAEAGRWPHPCSREVDAAHCLGSADAMPRALVGDSQGPVDASVILFALKHGAQSVPASARPPEASWHRPEGPIGGFQMSAVPKDMTPVYKSTIAKGHGAQRCRPPRRMLRLATKKCSEARASRRGSLSPRPAGTRRPGASTWRRIPSPRHAWARLLPPLRGCL